MRSKKKILAGLLDYLHNNYFGDKCIQKYLEELKEKEEHLAHRRKLYKERKFLKSLDSHIEKSAQNEYPIVSESVYCERLDDPPICYQITSEVRDYIYPLVLIEEQRCIIYSQEIPEILKNTKEQLQKEN